MPINRSVDWFLTGPVDRFFTEGFFHCSMQLMKNFQKEGGMGEVLNFVTPDEGLRKKMHKVFFARFANIKSILIPF